MPTFHITIINDSFKAANQEDLDDMEAAKQQALRGALEVGVEQLLGGQPIFGAEVIVADGDVSERFLVMLSTSPLL